MIRILGITVEHEIVENVPLEAVHSDQYSWCWVDFNQPTAKEDELLSSFFHFHPLAIEDCMHLLQRPKMDYYGDTQFLVLHTVKRDTLNAEEVDLFVNDRLLVSYHSQQQREVDNAWERVLSYRTTKRPVWMRGPIAAAYLIIDKIVDEYFPCVFDIEDELDTLEKLGPNEAVDELLNQVFALRSRLLKLRRTIIPMRDLMYRVINSQHIQQIDEHHSYFGDIYDHLLKLSDMIESDREMTSDLRDSYISLNSNRMNGIMKTLTVITTVFMPLTLIAGIYGMNFENMPELHWKYGYFAVLGLMVVLGAGMMLLFTKRGWFK
ncbi:magnesium/cobalt transporter CorA [Paenibacillus hunanensis]|uniref:magnesium/cobalt transporter CorA n=1 Tax=Paenibacillus hunanensis TaxID=539262 RepID=UPI002A6AFB03|nr:magnesium/cobalt transporter CorA [Paenibacillus hunanensis]WPP42176.1 magnesium/cobalt transporter CorA [Paenibacillus hunanensis]